MALGVYIERLWSSGSSFASPLIFSQAFGTMMYAAKPFFGWGLEQSTRLDSVRAVCESERRLILAVRNSQRDPVSHNQTQSRQISMATCKASGPKPRAEEKPQKPRHVRDIAHPQRTMQWPGCIGNSSTRDAMPASASIRQSSVLVLEHGMLGTSAVTFGMLSKTWPTQGRTLC